MAKKKTGGRKKRAKGAKPKWMTEEIFALSQNVTNLIEHFTGSATHPLVDADRAGMLLWRLLYPNDKKTAVKRQEAMKLGLIESALKKLNGNGIACKTAAIGILNVLVDTPVNRSIFFAAKTLSPMTSLLNCFTTDDICLAVYACNLLARLTLAADSKLRVMRELQGWNWTPIEFVLENRKVMSHMGGDDAIVDISKVIASICCIHSVPECTLPNVYPPLCTNITEAVVDSEIVTCLVQILGDRVPNRCKAAAFEALRILMRGQQSVTVRRVFVENHGRQSVVSALKNKFLTLPMRAIIAECAFLTLSPNESLSASSDGFYLIGDRLEEPAAVRQLVHNGVVPLLLEMCLGPNGPLPEVSLDNSAPTDLVKKKRKGKGKKRKSAKLAPGMAEAQIFGSGCLRALCTHEATLREIMFHGGIRFLAPLLSSKVDQTRWNARQVLMTLASREENVQTMDAYNLPKYITRSNVPKLSIVTPV